MAYLRLVSSSSKKEFAIAIRVIDGYFIDPKHEAITLYTHPGSIVLDNTFKNQWDNWDEFMQQVKARFQEFNDDEF